MALIFSAPFSIRLGGKKKDYLIPRNSFAIQIKSSNRKKVPVTKQIEYLVHLELPFFVGILDQKNFSLSIYSGEYLPILFCHQKVPDSLTLELRSQHDFSPDAYFEKAGKTFVLKCPLVSKISVTMDNNDLSREITKIKDVANRIYKNISARASNEFIFAVGADGHTTAIMAGSGSAKVFHENFKKRLAEVFYNLAWIADNSNGDLDVDEFRFYEKIYEEMQEREETLPTYLTESVKKIRTRFPIA